MVEFVSYTGSYPCLCDGELTVLIDGKTVQFGHDSSLPWHKVEKIVDTPEYNPKFWVSGGSVSINDDDCEIYCGPWELDETQLKPEYAEYAEELIEVFNENVPYGCCGGCI